MPHISGSEVRDLAERAAAYATNLWDWATTVAGAAGGLLGKYRGPGLAHRCDCRENGDRWTVCGIETGCSCTVECPEIADLVAQDRASLLNEEAMYEAYLDEADRLRRDN